MKVSYLSHIKDDDVGNMLSANNTNILEFIKKEFNIMHAKKNIKSI